MLTWENMSKHLHNSFCQQNASGHLWPQSVLKPQESAVQNNYSSRKSSPTFGMWKMLKVSGYIGTGDHLHTNDRNLNLCLVQKTFMDLFIQVEREYGSVSEKYWDLVK